MICFASSTLMALTAPTSKLFAAGTATSAARFIAVTSSSMRLLLAGLLQELGRFFQVARQLDAHLGVVEKPAAVPEQIHGRAGAALECGANAQRRVALRDAVARVACGMAAIAPSPAAPANPAVRSLRRMKNLP